MMIRALQQYGIPKPVPQPQVDTNRRKNIRQHSFTGRIDFYFPHALFPCNELRLMIEFIPVFNYVPFSDPVTQIKVGAD